MPCITSRPSRPALAGMSAALGATLAAAAIWSGIADPSSPPAPAPALTSGGKFAARAVDAVANDGLDTMPLPRVAAAPAPLPLMAASPAGIYRAEWEDARAPLDTSDRPPRAARPLRGTARADMRRVPAAAPDQSAVALAPPSAPDTAPDSAGQDGVLGRAAPRLWPAIASAARGAWAETASAGEALMSRVMPQIP